MHEQVLLARQIPSRDSTISDVRKDHPLKYMRHLPQVMMECGNTALLVIADHLVDSSLVLRIQLGGAIGPIVHRACAIAKAANAARAIDIGSISISVGVLK